MGGGVVEANELSTVADEFCCEGITELGIDPLQSATSFGSLMQHAVLHTSEGIGLAR